MRISDWSSDVCSSDLINSQCGEILLFGFGHGPGSCLDRGTFSVKSNDVQGNPVQSWSWDLLKLEALHNKDRKSDVKGKSVSVRVDLGGRRIIKKKKKRQQNR